MDFLEIRKKAKERAAAAKAASAPGAQEKAAGASAEPREEPRPAATGTGTQDRVLPETASPEGGTAAPTPDGRFTTWRPGSGSPPGVLPPAGAGDGLAPDPAARPAAGLVAAGALGRNGAPVEPADPLDDFFYRADESSDRIPALGAETTEPLAEPEPAALEEYLTFVLGTEEYAVPIPGVREVLRPPPITEVPRAPADVRGVVTVRGEVVPIFDLHRRLGLTPAGPAASKRIVIVDAGDGPCGLLVDAVANVVRLRPGAVEPCPQGIAVVSAESIQGIGRAGERIFMVLDLDALLHRAQPAPGEGDGRPDAGP